MSGSCPGTAMILAAGRGTRLAPLTDTTPKPMLPVNGKPLIEWQVNKLQQSGCRKIVINLHHLGDQIADYLGDGRRFGLEIVYSREETLLETGGGIVRALPHFDGAPFLLLNGDIWTDFDFNNLPDRPPGGLPAHIVLTPTPKVRDQGDFEYADGKVSARGSSYVYCGIAVLQPSLFEAYPAATFSFREVMFELIRTGGLSAQVYRGEWHDIGTLAQYRALSGE